MKDFTEQIGNSIEILFKLENEGSNKKLFDKKNVSVVISLFKIPRVHGIRKKYLTLRHSRFGSDPEICLFVPNRKSELEYKISTDDSIDITIDYYTNFLEKHKVQGISTIMPLKQLQSEYGLYELRRKLVNRFDLFLCKTSLLYNPRFLGALGKYFIQKNKEPLGISFPHGSAPYDSTFNESIQRAILSTLVRIKNFSDNYGIPIGTLSHSKKELEDNVKSVLNQILEENIIPGGFENIRAIYLRTSDTRPIPIYICKDFPVSLPTPKVKGRKRRLKKIVGEISTLPGKQVIIRPNGKVIVIDQSKPKNAESKNKNKKKDVSDEYEMDTEDDFNESDFNDDDDFDDDDYEKYNSDDDDVAFIKKDEENEESEEEDDEEIEKREERLLKESKRFKGEDEEEMSDDDDDDDDDDVEEEIDYDGNYSGDDDDNQLMDEGDIESEEESKFEAPPKVLRKTQKPATKKPAKEKSFKQTTGKNRSNLLKSKSNNVKSKSQLKVQKSNKLKKKK